MEPPYTQDPLFSQALADRVKAIQEHVHALTAESPDVSGKLQSLARSQQNQLQEEDPTSWEIPAADHQPAAVPVTQPTVVPMVQLRARPGSPAEQPPLGMMRPYQRSAVRRRSSLSITSLAHEPSPSFGSPSGFLYNKEPQEAPVYPYSPRSNSLNRGRGTSMPGEDFSMSRSGSGVIRQQSSGGLGFLQHWPLSEETWIGSESGLAEVPEVHDGDLEPVYMKPPAIRGMNSPVAIPGPSSSGSRSSRATPNFSVTKALESFSQGESLFAAVSSQAGRSSSGFIRDKPAQEPAWTARPSAPPSPVMQWPAPILPHSKADPRFSPPGKTRDQYGFQSSSGSSDEDKAFYARRSISLAGNETQTVGLTYEPGPHALPVRRTRTMGNLRVQALTSSGLRSAGVTSSEYADLSAPLPSRDSSDSSQHSEDYETSLMNTCPGGYEHRGTLYPELQLSMQLMTARLGDFKYRSMEEMAPEPSWQLNHVYTPRNRSGDGHVGSGSAPSAKSPKAAHSAQIPNMPYRRLRSNLSRGHNMQQQQTPIAEETVADVLSTHHSQVAVTASPATDSCKPLVLWLLLGLSVISGLLLLNTVVMLQAITIMQQAHGRT